MWKYVFLFTYLINSLNVYHVLYSVLGTWGFSREDEILMECVFFYKRHSKNNQTNKEKTKFPMLRKIEGWEQEYLKQESESKGGLVRTDGDRGLLSDMMLQKDLERPERQLREIMKEEHFMQKEHQKTFGKKYSWKPVESCHRSPRDSGW